MSEKPSQSFWEKPKCVLDVDPDGPSILTITLMRKEEGEHIQYKRKFTILQSYGHSPCSYTASTAKLFHALKQANTKENKHSVIEEQLQKKEFSCYAHGFGNWLPFVDAEGPIPAEIASLRHPLSSTDGSKKWKLHLDMRGFAPDNVHISIVEKSAAPTLKIEMRRMVDGANYAYFRKIDIPPGVKLSKLKCRKQDGVLNVEAPFKPLPPACSFFSSTDVYDLRVCIEKRTLYPYDLSASFFTPGLQDNSDSVYNVNGGLYSGGGQSSSNTNTGVSTATVVSATQPNVTNPIVLAQAPGNTYIQPSVAQPAQQSVAYVPAVAQSSYAYPLTQQQPVWNLQTQAYTYPTVQQPTYGYPQQNGHNTAQQPVYNPQTQSYVYPSVQQPAVNSYPNTQQQPINTPQTQSYTYPTVQQPYYGAQQPVNQVQGYSYSQQQQPNYYAGVQAQQSVASYRPPQPTNSYGYAPATNGYVNQAPLVTG